MNPCWETLFIFTGKGYAHQRVSPVNGIQIVEYFSAGCFVLNEENECSALVDMFICHIGESLKVVFLGWTGWFFLDTPVNKLVVPSFRVRGPDKFHDGINGFPGRCFAENKKIIFTERMFQNGTVGKAGSVRVHVFFRFRIRFWGHIRGDGKIPANSISKGGRDGIPSFQTEIIHAMRISLRYALSDAEPGKGRIVQIDGQASFTGQIRLPFLYGAGQFRCVHDYFSGQQGASLFRACLKEEADEEREENGEKTKHLFILLIWFLLHVKRIESAVYAGKDGAGSRSGICLLFCVQDGADMVGYMV